jgi:uncharacterized protein YkwD
MNAYLAALRPALRALVAGLAVAIATVGLTTVAAPANAAESNVSAVMSMSSGTYESKVLYYVNQKRSKHGLGRLRIESCTDGVAEHWAKYLADTDSFFHQDMGNVLDKCNAYYAGETLGRGAISPHRLVYLWMHSSAHRHVLLSPHAKRIGVGSYVDGHGQWVTAANFTQL